MRKSVNLADTDHANVRLLSLLSVPFGLAYRTQSEDPKHLNRLAMKKFLSILAAFFVVCAHSTPALAQLAASPRLSVQVSTNQTVRLAWPETAESYALEEASALNDLAPWTLVSQNSLLQDGEFSVTLNASQANRFFRLRIQGHTTIGDTSPAEGEQGVAVTRETVLRFTRPLAASTMLTANHLHAEFGGRRILSRIELSSDRTTVTLFYLENLPASARVRVTFDPVALLDFAGQLVDVDGDGQPGGIKLIDFDTLGTTPVGGTAVIGNVFASDPVPGTNTTNFINRPLAGVTITVDGMEETLRSDGLERVLSADAMSGGRILRPHRRADFDECCGGHSLPGPFLLSGRGQSVDGGSGRNQQSRGREWIDLFAAHRARHVADGEHNQ
jgi:hypothetical protein